MAMKIERAQQTMIGWLSEVKPQKLSVGGPVSTMSSL